MRIGLGGRDATRSGRLLLGRALMGALACGALGCAGPQQPAPAPPSTASPSTSSPSTSSPPADPSPHSEPQDQPAADQLSGAEPAPAPLPPTAAPPTSEGQLEGASGDASGSGKPCSVKDSNGPLPGGTSTTVGCDPGEMCQCNYQAGYSCGGVCVAATRK